MRSSDQDPNSRFGSFDALKAPQGEPRPGTRRLQDRIAERDAERGGEPSVDRRAAAAAAQALASAAPALDRRRPAGAERSGRDPLAADKLDPPTGKPSYARFIPREELGQVSSWQMSNFGGKAAASPSAGAATPTAAQKAEAARLATLRAAELAAQRVAQAAAERAQDLRGARDGGYQDGYRDGQAALEAFKQSHAAQTTAQMAVLLQTFQAQLDALEQDIATRVAGIAMALARQVVRHELTAQPQLVVAVAQEALGHVLTSARHITLRLHPQDHALVAAGVGDLLAARHARLLADPHLERGGCLVSADIGSVDASMPTRWQRAMASMGADLPWHDVAGGEAKATAEAQPASESAVKPAVDPVERPESAE